MSDLSGCVKNDDDDRTPTPEELAERDELPEPSKDKILFYLTRRLRDAEDAANVNHEELARRGVSYHQRSEIERNADLAKHEASALRAAVDYIRDNHP